MRNNWLSGTSLMWTDCRNPRHKKEESLLV